MSHDRKKEGQRKDKKMERMREAVADRKEHQTTEPHHTDQPDVVPYKSGSHSDTNRKTG